MGLAVARPHLLRMISRMTRNHAGANASFVAVLKDVATQVIVAQQGVQRTWWWAVQKNGVQAKAFFHFVGWFSHQAGNANRWAVDY